jgi:hypothetical protein
MTTHILAITYQPKIEGVKNGTIRQTIRPLSKVPRKVGDKLILHGWKGKPYRSPWSWRREEKVRDVFEMECYADHFVFEGGDRLHFNPWKPIRFKGKLDKWSLPLALARLDGISPPTGLELKHVLESYHGKFTDKPVQMQVIRW